MPKAKYEIRCCPCCQSANILRTLLGIQPGDYDPNTYACEDCGYVWRQLRDFLGS